ncbi:MAG: hypothetical protein A2W22_00495 [Candidatus Levybacteria bacterium RBG_16_35_11]|nr:MAG: hypothetical protein A2W22_00495 [Candidatus Levybacteria bacterium RBG_16_35_11]
MAYVKYVQSGQYLETYQYQNDLPERHFTNKKQKRSRFIRIYAQRRVDNVRRQKKQFIRLVRANLCGNFYPALFTFSMVESVPVECAWKIWSDFIKRARKRFGSDFRYITVIEFQKRGAPHFHALWWGLDSKLVKNERSDRTIQNIWGYGYVDCISTDGSPALAEYLAKYMQKSLSDNRLCGKKAYRASCNVLRPVSGTHKAFFACIDQVVDKQDIVFEVKYDVQYLGRCIYKIYKSRNAPVDIIN